MDAEEVALRLMEYQRSTEANTRSSEEMSRLSPLFIRYDFLRRFDNCDFEGAGVSGAAMDADGLLGGASIEQLRGEDATISPELWDGLLGPEDSLFLEHGFLA